jgi:hypothetical protein
MPSLIKMPRRVRIFSSKKADEGMSLNAIIGLILAVIAIAALTYLIFMVIGLFGKSNQELDSTVHNYEELTNLVKVMANNNDKNVSRFPLYVSASYSIIGFDRFQNFVIDQVNDTIYKPSSCRNKACICLYNNPPFYGKSNLDDVTTKDSGVINCISYNQQIIFFSKGRAFDRGHPDTSGLMRKDIQFDGMPLDTEYFVIHGLLASNLLGFNILKTEWQIKNLELKMTEVDKKAYFEISAVPDAETVRKEMVREAGYKLLQEFMTMPVPQDINQLTLLQVEGPVVAKDFLENHPEVYQGKTYEEFLKALYTTEGGAEKGSVFQSVSYSMFLDKMPKDVKGDFIPSGIFIDYPPLTSSGITDDYFVDWGLIGVTPTELLVSTSIDLGNNENAIVSFFITDLGNLPVPQRPDSSDAGAAWK